MGMFSTPIYMEYWQRLQHFSSVILTPWVSHLELEMYGLSSLEGFFYA